MNILVFSWRDLKHPLAGGAEQVMNEHMKEWIKANHKIVVFTSHFKNAPRKETINGITIYRYGYQLLGVHVLAVIWYLFLKKEKFDLVVDQFHGIPFFTPLYVRVKKMAVLQEIAREVWLMNHLPKPLNTIIGLLGYYLEPYIFLIYKKIPFMVGSQSAKDDLIKFGMPKLNITIVPHGVLTFKLAKTPTKESTDTIIFLGALAKDKGIEEALSVFSKLNKTRKFHFWIVGKGSDIYINYLKKLVNKLNIEKNTKFWGFVSDEQKFTLLGKSQILINPSFREGWGLVNIEANSMGTPVVAYRNAGLVDSIKDGFSGVLCNENTPDELCKNILKILDDKKFYQKLQRGALSWSKEFSWKESTAKSLEFIKDVATT